MLAVTAEELHADDPLRGLRIGDRPEPEVPDGWVPVRVRAASLNHHDVFSLRGSGVDPNRLPLILGCDAAGVTDAGREVVVHSMITAPTAEADYGNELLDPKASMLSEVYDGTFAETVVVPERNLIDKPAELSFAEAGCLPTAYLTAYRALFSQGGLKRGDSLLIQGAGGGVATAAILLGKAAGLEVLVTSRSEEHRARALEIGADVAFPTGDRPPKRVQVVLESVGEPTWSHSLRALEKGGSIVVIGATAGPNPPSDLNRVFLRQLRIIGSMMGTRQELVDLIQLLVETGVRPLIDTRYPLERAADALDRMVRGDLFGKLVLEPAA